MKTGDALKAEREQLLQQQHHLPLQSMQNMSHQSQNHKNAYHEQSSGIYHLINDSTIMKKIEMQQLNDSRDGQMRQCQDFADIVSIVSQEQLASKNAHPSTSSTRQHESLTTAGRDQKNQNVSQVNASENTMHSTQGGNSQVNYNINYFKQTTQDQNLNSNDHGHHPIQMDRYSQIQSQNCGSINQNQPNFTSGGRISNRETMPLNLTRSQQALNGMVSNASYSQKQSRPSLKHNEPPNFVEKSNQSNKSSSFTNGQKSQRNHKVQPTFMSNAQNTNTSSQAKMVINQHTYNTPGYSSKQYDRTAGGYSASQSGKHASKHNYNQASSRQPSGMNLQIQTPNEQIARVNAYSGLHTTKNAPTNLICSPQPLSKISKGTPSQTELRKDSYSKQTSRNYYGELKTSQNTQQKSYGSQLQYHQKYKADDGYNRAVLKSSQMSNMKQKSVGAPSQKKTHMYSSNTQKLSGLVTSSSKAGNLEQTYFQHLVQQQQPSSPKAIDVEYNHQQFNVTEGSVSSPTQAQTVRGLQAGNQVYSPDSKQVNNTAYSQMKANQKQMHYDHNQNREKMRKDTIDKTIETIKHMKLNNSDVEHQYIDQNIQNHHPVSGHIETAPSNVLKKECFSSAQVTNRAKSSTTNHNFKQTSSRQHLTNQPLISTRGANQTVQSYSKYSNRDKTKIPQQTSSSSRPVNGSSDNQHSQIYSDYRNFIEKQRKIVAQLSQSKTLDRAESLLETITENRAGTVKTTVTATPRGTNQRKTSYPVQNQHSNTKLVSNEISKKKSNGVVTHRKDFISENKKLSSGAYNPSSASKTKAQSNIVTQRKSSSQVATANPKRDAQPKQMQQKLNSTLNPQSYNQKMSSSKSPRVQNGIPFQDDKSPKSSAFSFYNGKGNIHVSKQQLGVTQFIPSSGAKASRFSSKPNLNNTQTFARSSNFGSKIQTHRDNDPTVNATPRGTQNGGVPKQNLRKGSENIGHKSFVSSKGNQSLLNKGQPSRSALQQYPQYQKTEQRHGGDHEDFVKTLQQQNQMLQNTAAELLNFAAGTKTNPSDHQDKSQKSSASKAPREQGLDQLVLTEQLITGPQPNRKSDVQNMLIDSKKKRSSHAAEKINTPSSAGAPAVLLSSSQIKRDQEAFESSIPKPFSTEVNRKNSKSNSANKKKSDKENIVTQPVKESTPKDANILQQNNQQNVQQEVAKMAETKKDAPAATDHATQQKTEPSKPLDDTMVFSEKTSLDDYIIGKQIGQGAYAVVRIGLHKPTNQKVAMKIYKKYKLEEPNRRKSVKREIKLMEKMRQSNIIQLYEIIDTQKYVILVMEYIGGGSLHGYLKSKTQRRLEENDAKRIFKEIVDGLKYCHSRCITHRDIKLENLLLDEHGAMKIIDFGFSTCIPNDKKIKIFCGTPSYMAPEIVLKTEYCGPPADIWALGVLLFTCLSGQFPYRGATDEELYDKICRADYNLPEAVKSTLSPEAIDLLAKLFKIKAEERPSARELLQHPWFSHITSQNSSDLNQLQLQKRAKSQNLNAKGANTHRDANYQSKQPQPTVQPKLTNRDLQYNPFNGQMQSPAADHATQARQLQIDGQMQPMGRSNSHVIGKQSQTQKHCSRKQLIFSGEEKSPRQDINHDIVKIIVDKLGYTSEEVMRYLLSTKEQNSFVSNLYERLLDEDKKRGKSKMVSQGSLGENAFSASGFSLGFGQGNQLQNLGVKPSYVPSVKSVTSATGGGSYMNLSNNLKSNNFNNTQPLSNRYFNNTADSNSAVSPQNQAENLRLAQTFSSSTRSGYGNFFLNQTQNTYRGSSTTPQGMPMQQHNNFFSNTGDQTQQLDNNKMVVQRASSSNIINMSQESPDFNKQAAHKMDQGMQPHMFYGHDQDAVECYGQNNYQMVNQKVPTSKSAISQRMERV